MVDVDPRVPVDSRRALDVVRESRAWLTDCDEDLRRELRSGLRPCYVVDFELLYLYCFQADQQPDRVGAIARLLESESVDLFVGPGTAFEVWNFLARRLGRGVIGAVDRMASGLELTGPLAVATRELPQQVTQLRERSKELPEGIALLVHLLTGPNVVVADPSDWVKVDDAVLRAVRETLEIHRPGLSDSNYADALNFAFTVTARQDGLQGTYHGFPYLLTSTAALLNESVLLRLYGHEEGSVSREPMSAMHLAVLREYFPELENASEHVLDKFTEVARLEPTILSASSKSDELPFDLVDRLAAYLDDPVLMALQQLRDDIDVVQINIAKQRGAFDGQYLSGERFIERLIAMARRHPSNGGNWRGRFDSDVRRTESGTVVGFTAGGKRSEALRVEVYPGFVSVSWTNGLDMGQTVELIGEGYLRHGFNEVTAVLGQHPGGTSPADQGPIDIVEVPYEVTLPVTQTDIEKVAQESGLVWWIRFDCPSLYDVFMDVVSYRHRQMIGVIGENLDLNHTAELLSSTSAAFVPVAMARSMLSWAVDQVGEGIQ